MSRWHEGWGKGVQYSCRCILSTCTTVECKLRVNKEMNQIIAGDVYCEFLLRAPTFLYLFTICHIYNLLQITF